MKRKVRIIAMPKAGSGLEVKVNSGMGFNSRQMNWPLQSGEYSAPAIEVKKTITGDPNPTIEAEGGETIVDDRDKDGIAEHYKISGPRHTQGGVEINAGENAFVFSDTKAMKIGGDILKSFNKTSTKKITPADIAKQYDINEYLKALKDPDVDDLQLETAKMMIANYNKKLGALALVQESKKGFDAGVPVISHDYLQSIGMDPNMFTQNLGQSEEPEGDMGNMARYGGNFPKAQTGKGVTAQTLAEAYRLKQERLTKNNPIKSYSITKDYVAPLLIKGTKKAVGYLADNASKQAKLRKDENYQKQLDLLSPQNDSKAHPEGLEDVIMRIYSDVLTGGVPKLMPNLWDIFMPTKEKEETNNKAMLNYYKSLDEMTPYEQFIIEQNRKLNPSKSAPKKRLSAEKMSHVYSKYKPKVVVNPQPAVMPGVTAAITEPPAALTDTSMYEKDVNLMTDAQYDEIAKRHNIVLPFKKQYGGSLPKHQKGPESDREKALRESKKAQTKQSSGKSGVNQGNWQASELAPYGMADAYKPKGLEYMNAFNKEYGLDLVDVNSGETGGKAAIAKLQAAIIAKHPELVPDYMLNSSHKPNEQLMGIIPTGYTKDQAGLKKAYADGKLSKDQISKGYQDNQWWYRALTSKRHKLNKADYDKQMAMPGSIKEGDKSYYRNEKSPLIYDEYYTEEDAPRDPGARVNDRSEEDYKPTVNKFVPGTKRNVPDEYWLQDSIRQHGNARDYLTLKKYMPWQATPDFQRADAVFEDPNRGIAAMQEGVNAQNQLMGTFAGPQGLARSQASARGANSMADYIAGVANRNVDRANSLEQFNTQIGNQAGLTNAGLATNLFDKNTIANQQYDNSKRQILRNMDDTQIAAETNRAYTHNLNQLKPHYNIRPSMGGNMQWTGQPDPLAPSYQDPDAWLKQYAHYREQMPATVTDDAIIKLLSQFKNNQIANPYNDDPSQGMYPG